MDLLWITDIHLDYLFPSERKSFLQRLGKMEAELVLVGGDISKSVSLEKDLMAIQKATKAQVYFVLGNHDYFGSSFSAVHDGIGRLIQETTGLHWLDKMSHASITKDVALVGHGCWGDAGIGSYWKSELHRDMPDFREIRGLKILNRHERLQILKKLGEAAANHLRESCNAAVKEHSHVIILTHVPIFPQTVMDYGSKENVGLPFFCCLAAGKAILEMTEEFSNVQFTVLSGHSHQESRLRLRPNLVAIVHGAQYYKPNGRMFHLENGVLLDKGIVPLTK